MKTTIQRRLSCLASGLLLTSISTTAMADLAAGKAQYALKKYAEALQELKPAAMAGDPEAQSILGSMYANGLGTEKNSMEAFAWYSKAAAQGNSDAEIALSDMYRSGNGVDTNPPVSAYWQMKAAEALALTAKEKVWDETKIYSHSKANESTYKSPRVISKEPDGSWSHCMPEYPPAAEQANSQGTTLIAVLVGADGKAKDASVIRSSGWPLLDEATMSAFKSCKYEPGVKNEKPVESIAMIRYVWKITDETK